MSTSGDGLVLLEFIDLARKANVVSRHRSAPTRELPGGFRDPDVTRFVCNPISGQLSRLPYINGTKKSLPWSKMGILTQSELPQQPPARYAVAVLTEENDWGQQSFVMRRFLSHTGGIGTSLWVCQPHSRLRGRCSSKTTKFWPLPAGCGASTWVGAPSPLTHSAINPTSTLSSCRRAE
jgi:hypothetical protein